MFKMERLAMAITTHEGWITPNTTGYVNGSMSFRNHNPGNMRSSPFQVGKRDGFAVFRTDWDGMQALIWDLTQKAKGNTQTKLNGESTLSDLIHVWAPAADKNDPDAYVKHICQITGFSATMKLRELLI